MQKQIPGVFLGSLLITTVGFLDDRYDVSPAVKFFAQAAAAGILLSIGLSVNFLEGLGLLGYFVTFLWIMMIMNAFNFIDSIDGHCIGVSLVSCLVFYAISLIVFQPVLGVMVMTLGGSLAALLRFNWKPAKIFLGDTGSLFLGYIMAALTLLYTYRSSQYSIVTPFIPILMFGVPIYDTVSVIAVRLYRGIPPWKGDRNHFAHRLVKLGMSAKIAVVVSYFISFTLGLVAILSTQVHTFLGKLLIVLIFLSIMGIITLFEYYAAMRIRRMERIALRRKSIPPNPSE